MANKEAFDQIMHEITSGLTGDAKTDLAYLQENYGLSVNTRDFYIHYDAFASNLPPDVRVEVRPAEGKKEGGR